MREFNLKLNEHEIEIVTKSLFTQPYQYVNMVIANIQTQLRQQVDSLKAEPAIDKTSKETSKQKE